MEQKYQIGNDYGSVMWDVERIISEKDKFVIREFDVRALSMENKFNGNEEYAMGTDVTEPLIIVNLIGDIDKLIDGNHRLLKAARLGMDKIMAYYLSGEEHRQYIVDYDEKIYLNVVSHWKEGIKISF